MYFVVARLRFAYACLEKNYFALGAEVLPLVYALHLG